MKIKGIALAALAVLGLAACDELEGVIQVKSSLPVVNKKGEKTIIPAGTYQSQFDYDSDKRRLKIKIKDVNDHDQKLELNLPNGVEIPTQEGSFVISGEDVGQSFDLRGYVHTDTQISAPTQTTESCTLYRTEYVCREESYQDSLGKTCYRQVCGNEEVPYSGEREVQYHSISTTVSAQASFISSASVEVAKLSGSRNSSQTVYDYVGTCYSQWGLIH